MEEPYKNLTEKLLDLMTKTGYPLVQHNGQRKFGPPSNWTEPAPTKGCEVFIGKLPREIFEDELVPLFSRVGKIYEMRLMMDFSGSNRGYAFVTYATRAEASRAVKELNGYEIRPRRHIGVVKSVDNCRLFIGNIPKTKTKEEVFEELSKRVSGIVEVILYKHCFNKNQNRGFAFLEFTSHRAAAMARRQLVPGCVKIWDQEVLVDWAEPEPDIDDEQMKKVKVLYVRNFHLKTTVDAIRSVFEAAINNKVERIKKIFDYAFIHFYQREHAELALAKLQNTEIDGSVVEIRWSKPVIREVYHIQKMNKGNAKFNNNFNLSQTLSLYKQQLEKKEYDERSPQNSAYAGDSTSGSPSDSGVYPNQDYSLAPAKLASICKRYMWALPQYNFNKFLDASGTEIWFAQVELPLVGTPLLNMPQRLGPFGTRPCLSMQQAQIEAAETALKAIKLLKVEPGQQSLAPPPPVFSSMSPIPHYYSSIYSQHHPGLPVALPLWKSI